MTNLSSQQKKRLSVAFPEYSGLFDDSNEFVSKVFAGIQMYKGEKGDRGDDGYTPIKGKDYWTDADVNNVINYILKNVKVPKGDKGDNYIITSEDKKEIAAQIKVPIVEKIIERTEVIKEISKKVSIEDIKGAVSQKELEIEKKTILDGMAKVDGRIKLIDQRWRGGGLSKVSHDSTLTGDGTPSNPLSVVGGGTGTGLSTIGLSGAINDTNTSFTVPTNVQSITSVVVNGQPYQATGGAITWTFDGTTITLSNPVGLGGSIFAIGFVLSSETVVGTINDTNVIFTTPIQPQLLIINGLSYLPTGGSYTWTYSNGTITLSNPVGSGGSISAIYNLGVLESDGSISFSSGFSNGFF